MISLLLNHLYSNKNKIIISIYLFLLILIYVIPLPLDINKDELYFQSEYYITTYDNIIKELTKMVVSIFTLIITIDHDHKYINNITTYKSRSYVLINKLLIYFYILFINSLIITILYYLILNISNLNNLIIKEYYLFTYSVFIDSILIMILILLFINKENKYLSYLILTIYLIINFYYNINLTLFIYYLLPFNNYYYRDNTNIIYYQLVYLLLLISVTYNKYLIIDFK